MLYVVVDPFKVVRYHEQYLSDFVMLHRGYISTKMYLRNRQNYNFNSFIFGSSHSCAHLSRDWEKYLHEESRAFSYGSWNEGIEGISRKLALIDTLGDQIENAFIIIDGSTFDKRKKPMGGEHYLISGKTKMEFHYYYFKEFLDLRLMVTSINYFIFKEKRKYMDGFEGMKSKDLDIVNNNWLRDMVPADSASYYANCAFRFYERDTIQKYYPKKIEQQDINDLLKIKKIFDKHKTNFYLVISPLYDQMMIDSEDLAVLQKIFGEKNIYNYAGINSFTKNKFNYLEDVFHYRYEVGALIFAQIYTSQKVTQNLYPGLKKNVELNN